MSRELEIRNRLQAIEQALHDAGLWQTCAPNAEAFESTEPFCVDTMMPIQWLQWVFLPRMQALLDAQSALPVKLAIALIMKWRWKALFRAAPICCTC